MAQRGTVVFLIFYQIAVVSCKPRRSSDAVAKAAANCSGSAVAVAVPADDAAEQESMQQFAARMQQVADAGCPVKAVFEQGGSFAMEPQQESGLALASGDEAYQKAYPFGDFYILQGNFPSAAGAYEYEQLYYYIAWMNRNGFRTILNLATTEEDLREAVQNPRTSVIVWGSHGCEEGATTDAEGKVLPDDVFRVGTSARLRAILFATCYGERVGARYAPPPPVAYFGWNETIKIDRVTEYLNQRYFDQALEKLFGIALKAKKTFINVAHDTVRRGEAIEVSFYGLPGNRQDVLILADKKSPTDQRGENMATISGKTFGSFSLPTPRRAGTYEIRAYFDWPKGGWDVKARRAITVNP